MLTNFDISTRSRLAMPRTSWQLCFLAMIGGTVSASVIVLFIWAIESIQGILLEDIDHYTSLNDISRFLLPIIGALCILLFATITGYQYSRTGIPFVLHRLKVAYGVIPLRNTINQFFGGILALASGFSVGKEGPAVHLGAACSGYIGNKLNLPSNSIRTLSACGVAAGIAACFNTPVAAVIFVMEVILREYKVHMFIPIMLAAIIGSMMTSQVYGPAHEFEFFNSISISYSQYPWLVLLGVVLGALASLFNRYLVLVVKHFQHIHIAKRFMLAGLITGAIGYSIPQAMGTDLSAINFIMEDNAHLWLLIVLLFAKIALTTAAIGLGVPGGIIGPILGIGAVAGAVMVSIISTDTSSIQMTSDFALMGMAGFMAATLNAPLAALLAVVELSNQLEVIVPAMLVISASCLASGQFFKNRSIFIMQLNMQKLAYRKPPIEDSLHHIGALGVMQRNLSILDKQIFEEKTSNTLQLTHPNNHLIMRIRKDNEYHYFWHENADTTDNEVDSIYDELKNGVNEKSHQYRQHQLHPLSSKDTLSEAYWALKEERCGAVYVYDKQIDNILGIITFEQIRQYLLEGKLH